MEEKETIKYSIIDVESPAYTTVCDRCGAHVERKKLHTEWHERIGENNV